MSKKKKKVIFIASSGGHLTQLLQLQPLFQEFKSVIITEKDTSTSDLSERFDNQAKILYFPETRKNNILKYIVGNIISLFLSIKYFLYVNPDIIVSTGAGISVYLSYISKIFGRKVIFIETYAAIKAKSGAGKLIYPIADRFYIQWRQMKKFYPKANFKGTLY